MSAPWNAQDTAKFLCKYSRGVFPNWFLWPEYQHYLKAEEKEAIEYVSQRLLKNVVPTKRPKYIAAYTFMANHTQCLPALNDGVAQVMRDSTGAAAVSFQQTIPIIPNIPEISISPYETPLEQHNRWLNAFEKAYHGETYSRNATIVVEPANGQYILRSDIRNSFADPLKVQKFWKTLDEYRFTEAIESLTVLCVQNEDNCRKLRPFLESAVLWRQKQANQFANDVEISNIHMTHIALTGSSSYTAVQMTLNNRSSHIYSNIQLTTNETEPQICILQSERTKREDRPLTLNPNETTTAWCALNSATKPWTMLNFWIAD